jgi:hypothetical protein
MNELIRAAKVGAVVGAAMAVTEFMITKTLRSIRDRKDNGNFAKAEDEITTGEFHRDPPEDSKVAYEVAKEPDAAV